MITVVKITDGLRRIRLVNRLKDRGISRISDGRYVDELTLDELWSEWKKVIIDEQKADLLVSQKERNGSKNKQGAAVALPTFNRLEGDV